MAVAGLLGLLAHRFPDNGHLKGRVGRERTSFSPWPEVTVEDGGDLKHRRTLPRPLSAARPAASLHPKVAKAGGLQSAERAKPTGMCDTFQAIAFSCP
jgi:hypothetical protein